MSENKHTCTGYYKRCKNEATIQLACGDWYCFECYSEGLRAEEEAMGIWDEDYLGDTCRDLGEK